MSNPSKFDGPVIVTDFTCTGCFGALTSPELEGPTGADAMAVTTSVPLVTIPSSDVSVGEHETETAISSDNMPINGRGEHHEDSDRR